jgi:hypothetical protein
MKDSTTVEEALIAALQRASIYNPDVQVKPACVLWPDKDRQWEAAIPRLQSELTELLALGDYRPDQRSGPAIWLRCAIAGLVDDVAFQDGRTPILYLPGVSRQDLRAVEQCDALLKPLAELQYRGVIWSQINAKDWTILAFLKSDQGGLGLDVAQDAQTKRAMQLALYRLLDEDISLLKGKRLDKDYFNTLLTGGDPIRDLLYWLDQGEAFVDNQEESAWLAFVQVIESQLGFNPQQEGVLAGAEKLAIQEGPWKAVWERFCEAPHRYPNIPSQIERCKPPEFDLFTDAISASGWPQWNEQQEQQLLDALRRLEKMPPHDARASLLELENRHQDRRRLVWAELGRAPLALAMEHLAALARITQKGLDAGTLEDLSAGYSSTGWKADDAVLQALAAVKDKMHTDAVQAAIRAVYLPWLEASAHYLQQQVEQEGYPGGTRDTQKPFSPIEGECVLFVDGLRFDTAKRLQQRLDSHGLEVVEIQKWTALPSVTATGKAAVSPVRHLIAGKENNQDFEPCVMDTGQSLKGGYHFKKLLKEAGWQILDKESLGDGKGYAWTEIGDIDHEGHDRGWKLGRYIDGILLEVAERITALLQVGWKQVRVVTDHGWLLMPGGLPGVVLPKELIDTKWKRCASVKPGAHVDGHLFPWYWNVHQHFALADGVSCFSKGQEYTHGGLSLQECLTLELVITQLGSAGGYQIDITDIVWRGLRCTIAVDGDFGGIRVDIRTEAGNADTSAILSIKGFKKNGTASVVVEDEDLEGKSAFVVLLDDNDNLLAQAMTVIGGEDA